MLTTRKAWDHPGEAGLPCVQVPFERVRLTFAMLGVDRHMIGGGMRHYLKALLALGMGSMLPTHAAVADGMSLAGSFWRCTRAADKS